VPFALLLVALECAAVAGAAAALLARDLGWSPWWGLSVAMNPGLVYSVTAVTTESAGLAATLLALLAWRRGRRGWAAAAVVAACLIKEPFVLLAGGLALYEVLRWVRHEVGTRATVRAVAPLALGPAVLAAWQVYVWQRFDVAPTGHAHGLIAAPLVGWIDTLKRAAYLDSADFSSAQIGAATIPLLLAVGLALAVGIVRSRRVRTEVQAVFLLLALLAFTLNWFNLLYTKDMLRALTVVLALLPFVFAPTAAGAAAPSATER
jgi:hypothetical protein